MKLKAVSGNQGVFPSTPKKLKTFCRGVVPATQWRPHGCVVKQVPPLRRAAAAAAVQREAHGAPRPHPEAGDAGGRGAEGGDAASQGARKERERVLLRLWMLLFFLSPTAESFGVSAQIGSGVVRGGPEVRFHESSTRV